MVNEKKQISIGAIISYATIAFNILTGLLYTPWMIREIGDDQYALYTLAISVINIFMLDFGISSAVAKFLSNYYAAGQHNEVNRFMGIVYKLFICLAGIIAVLLFGFYFLIDGIYQNLTPEELVIYKRLFIIVASYSVLCFPFTTNNSVLMANERFIAVKLCGFGQKAVSVLLIVITLVAKMGVYAMVLANALSNVVFVAIKYLCIKKETSLRADFKFWDKSVARQLFDYSVWVTVGNIAGRFIFSIMPTIIAALIGSVEVTIFGLASSLEGYVFSFSEAINGMFMPKISRILGQKSATQKLSDLMGKVGRFHVISIGLIYLGFICVGREFVTLWLGDGYELVYICALILIFPSMIDVPQQIARTALLAKDIVKEQALIYIGMAVANVICSFVLLPLIGVVGAAISICIAYLLRTVAFNVLYHKRLSIDIGAYFKKTYIRWCGVALGTLAVGLAIGEFIPEVSWIGLFGKAVLIVLVYLLLLWAVGLNKNEHKQILSMIKRR